MPTADARRQAGVVVSRGRRSSHRSSVASFGSFVAFGEVEVSTGPYLVRPLRRKLLQSPEANRRHSAIAPV
jgi:hypothetical protein